MNIKRYLILLTTAGFLSTGIAATDETEIRFYDVEVIIFKNEVGPKSQEYVLPVASPRVDGQILDLSSPSSIEAAKEKSYEIIPTEELRLTEQVISIVKSRRYSLLAHAGWRQPGLEKQQAMSVWIKGGRLYGNEYTSIDNQIDLESMANNELIDPGESASILQNSDSLETALIDDGIVGNSGLYELEGKITIALARYLHTEAQLVLRKPRLSIEDLALDEIEVSQLGTGIQSDTTILNNHSLNESRRMRSKNLHYLDSPEFSLLVLITPYEAPDNVEVPDPGQVEETVKSETSVEVQQ
jgi:hypothetical protein